jgi:preprotein translocase SecE subunit
MASVVTRGNEGNDPMAGEEHEDEEREEREQPVAGRQAQPAGGVGGGFFHVYKPGQGYWTRLCTVLTAGALVLVTAQFLYVQLLRARFNVPVPWAAGSVGALVVGAVVALWYYLNKPVVVDFLIATESEMKKVNWTSRKELFGSTKVVILFMFIISGLLFFVDVMFGYFFHLIGVLRNGPFGH